MILRLWRGWTTPANADAYQRIETAYVPPRAREVLARFDERSAHFETLLTPDETR